MNALRVLRAMAAVPLLLLAGAAGAQWLPIEGEDDEPIPSAPEILQRLRDAFPAEPLAIHAVLERRGDGAAEARSFLVRLRLAWGDTPPTAQVRVADAFGRPLAAVDIRYRPEGADFLFEGEAPDPHASILGTDFTWADLGLTFLWWPGGEVLGFESRRGRRCFVIDLPAPDPSGQAASVRLWIDAFVYALLQAEVRAADGTPVRRMSVRSLRRVGLRWTLEDLEMRTLEPGTRTLLRVQELYAIEAPVPEDTP